MVKPIIAVTGATGRQGSSVVQFLLKDKGYAVRGTVRDTGSVEAQDLKKLGVEVVQADFNDYSSLEKAFTGAYGVFAMTDFWTAGAKEKDQGINMVNAAKKQGVKHFIWSSLGQEKLKDGTLVPIVQYKAEVDTYLQKSGVPYTTLNTTFFMENVYKFAWPLKRTQAGALIWDLPFIRDALIASYSVQDTGGLVLPLLKNPEKWLNKSANIATEFISPESMCKILTRELGENVECKSPTHSEFEKIPHDPTNNPAWYLAQLLYENQSPPYRDPELTYSLYPGVSSYEAFVQKDKETIKKDIKPYSPVTTYGAHKYA